MKINKQIVAASSAVVAVAAAVPAMAADLIDYSSIATSMTTSAGLAITAAVGVGAAVLIAKLGWKFFKSFTH